MNVKYFLRTSSCRSILFFFILAFYLVIGATDSFAQSTGGRIRGTVTDASGGGGGGADLWSRNPSNRERRGVLRGVQRANNFFGEAAGQFDPSSEPTRV